MLLPQIAYKTRKELVAEFGVDLRIVKGPIQTTSSYLDSVIPKLQAVEDSIVANEDVDPIDSLSSWITGQRVWQSTMPAIFLLPTRSPAPMAI